MRKFLKRDNLFDILFIFCLSLVPLLWYKNPNSFAIGHDLFFPLDPLVLFRDRMFLWSGQLPLGFNYSQFIGLIILKTDQSLDDYYNSTYNDPNDPETKVLEKEKSTIQGKGLLKFTYVNFINTLKTNNPQGAKARKALVKINNGIMIFSYSIEEYKKDESKIFDSMIDSLRFTR